jgi:hypothetical protein
MTDNVTFLDLPTKDDKEFSAFAVWIDNNKENMPEGAYRGYQTTIDMASECVSLAIKLGDVSNIIGRHLNHSVHEKRFDPQIKLITWLIVIGFVSVGFVESEYIEKSEADKHKKIIAYNVRNYQRIASKNTNEGVGKYIDNIYDVLIDAGYPHSDNIYCFCPGVEL